MAAKILNVDEAKLVRSAGGIICRNGSRGATKVALIHRPGYDDWTFPKGKVDAGESLEETALREVEEETGLPVSVDRFVGLILYAVRRRPRPFASYVFLLSTDKLHPRVHDPSERISGFKEVSLTELRAVTQRLRELSDDWRVWGKFRALAHELVANALDDKQK